ncbi:MAG: hypothetical protein Q7T74_03155 [Candidatus Saccharibacteria bacterium]|nr:hypothetical protein [Candidatus Saccharibacteria bacterium]
MAGKYSRERVLFTFLQRGLQFQLSNAGDGCVAELVSVTTLGLSGGQTFAPLLFAWVLIFDSKCYLQCLAIS